MLLVGGGPQEAALQAQAQQLGVPDKVVFTGRVPHAEVQRYYDLIDVLAYPRHSMRLTELVTPLKPLEAMAQGRLLVASDVGGHQELIRDGETGSLFRAGDARRRSRRRSRTGAGPSRRLWERDALAALAPFVEDRTHLGDAASRAMQTVYARLAADCRQRSPASTARVAGAV